MKRRARALTILGLLVTACGGGGNEGKGVAGDCAGIPAAELGAVGVLCVDSGLRPATGGFSFPNWGGLAADDSVTVTTAIAVFGKEAVCVESNDTSCTPFPAAKHWIDAANADMNNGRCEGMAVLSQRLFSGLNTPEQLQASANKTFDLERPTVPVVGSIARWWVTQRLEKVIQSSNKWAQAMPSAVTTKLIEALDEKAGVTLGIYNDGGGGHAVTPIAVTKGDDGKYAIMLFDNNFPNEVTSLSVDPEAERWTYEIGAMNAGEGRGTWTGGKGSMDLTVMADREGDQKVPWSNDDRAPESKGSARISVSTGGASYAGLIIEVGGITIDSRDVASATNGIKIFPNRGGADNVTGIGTGAMVEIPVGLANVKVTPVVGELTDPNDATVDLTVAIDAPGPGSQLITDQLTNADLADGTYDDFSLDLSTNDGYASTVDVADDGEIEVGVAYEEESLAATLEDGQDLSVADPEGEGDFALKVTSEGGETVYEASYDGVDDDGTLGAIDLDIDEETGVAVISETPIESEELNDDLLKIAAADNEVTAVTGDTVDESTPATNDGSVSSELPTTDTEPANSVTDSDDEPTDTDVEEPPDTDPPAPADTEAPAPSDAESGADD